MRANSGGLISISRQLHDALLPDYAPEATYLLSIEAVLNPRQFSDTFVAQKQL